MSKNLRSRFRFAWSVEAYNPREAVVKAIWKILGKPINVKVKRISPVRYLAEIGNVEVIATVSQAPRTPTPWPWTTTMNKYIVTFIEAREK